MDRHGRSLLILIIPRWNTSSIEATASRLMPLRMASDSERVSNCETPRTMAFHRVLITYGDFEIPAKYNTETEPGFELSPIERDGNSAEFHLKLR